MIILVDMDDTIEQLLKRESGDDHGQERAGSGGRRWQEAADMGVKCGLSGEKKHGIIPRWKQCG